MMSHILSELIPIQKTLTQTAIQNTQEQIAAKELLQVLYHRLNNIDQTN